MANETFPSFASNAILRNTYTRRVANTVSEVGFQGGVSQNIKQNYQIITRDTFQLFLARDEANRFMRWANAIGATAFNFTPIEYIVDGLNTNVQEATFSQMPTMSRPNLQGAEWWNVQCSIRYNAKLPLVACYSGVTENQNLINDFVDSTIVMDNPMAGNPAFTGGTQTADLVPYITPTTPLELIRQTPAGVLIFEAAPQISTAGIKTLLTLTNTPTVNGLPNAFKGGVYLNYTSADTLSMVFVSDATSEASGVSFSMQTSPTGYIRIGVLFDPKGFTLGYYDINNTAATPTIITRVDTPINERIRWGKYADPLPYGNEVPAYNIRKILLYGEPGIDVNEFRAALSNTSRNFGLIT